MTVSRIALALLAGLTLPGAAVAEVLSTSDPTIENSLCVGRDCGDPAASDFRSTRAASRHPSARYAVSARSPARIASRSSARR